MISLTIPPFFPSYFIVSIDAAFSLICKLLIWTHAEISMRIAHILVALLMINAIMIYVQVFRRIT